MDPRADILRILKGTALKEVIMLPLGQRVDAIPSVATTDDALNSPGAVSGYTKTLTCATTPAVDDLVPVRDWVRRSNGRKYYVTNASLLGKGALTKLFLGDEVVD